MSKTNHLLVLEDEKNVGLTLVEKLRQEGFDVTWSKTLTEALESIHSKTFDLALLDVLLPDGSGFDAAQAIRNTHSQTAIIFLTALDSPEDRIRGLELGAEDYVSKPFHLKELILRIQNGLKRSQYFSELNGSQEDQISIGKSKIEFSKFKLTQGQESHTLTHRECALLKLLSEKRGTAVSRDEILDRIWAEDEYPSPRTVDNFIVKLRKLIEPSPENPQYILSIRGVGYLLKEEEFL